MAEPSRVQRQLATELYTLRNLAGLSQRNIRDAAGKGDRGKDLLSQSTISRAERAEQVLDKRQTGAWLDAVDADQTARDRVLALTESATSETRSWADLLASHNGNLQEVARARNVASKRVQNLSAAVLPGLLQTAEYARNVLGRVHDDPGPEVAARIARQQVLYEPDRRFQFVIAERLLRPSAGLPVAAAQLHQLASLATLASVDIAVLPDDADVEPVYHGFVLRDPVDDSGSYVVIELAHGEHVVTDPGKVNVYELLWADLWGAALTGDEAVARIRAAT